ncbi:class I SAM-dependent methyltransferase [Brevundimonas sp. 2R-24]|uniref:Class I SAM-dependent methyltransferase n=1 Tax=Peiella sedimenti TaxID=3061083 RepID=A0ABT8SMY7_9CAUL|nr:class I SAM-dependent methyltransferase [Caulobacteraceae bacterium XZ-24]
MRPAAFNRIAYAEMGICNPLADGAFLEALGRADLPPGARACDLGCGNAHTSILMAGAGLQATAVERDPDMAELAAERIAARGAAVELKVGEGLQALDAQEAWSLIVAIGTTALTDPGPARFAGLAARLAPGGRLLFGDLMWKAEPDPAFRDLLHQTAVYESHAGWIEAGRASGLQPLWDRVSTEAEWDAYAGAMTGAVEAWIAANPDRPEASALRNRVALLRAMQQGEAGRTLGFGLYLFGKA